NVVRVGTESASEHLGADCTAIAHFPCRPCVVPTNRFSRDKQCRDRLAKLPDEFADRTVLAFVNLRADSVDTRDRNFTRYCDCIWHFGCGRQWGQHPYARGVGRQDQHGSDQRSSNTKELSSGLGAPAKHLLVPAIDVAGLPGSAMDILRLHSTLHSFSGRWNAPFRHERL